MVKLQLGEVLQRGLRSTRALSPLGIAIWVPWGSLRMIYRSMMAGEPISITGLGATLAIVTAAGLATSWLVRVTLLRNQRNYRSNAWLTLASYLIVLATISFVQEVTEKSLGTGFGFSISRLATGLIGFYLLASLLEYFDTYRDYLTRLRAEQGKLNRIRRDNARDLARMRSRVVSQLVTQLQTPWGSVERRLTELPKLVPQAKALHDLAGAIRTSLITPIREISYKIQQAGSFVQKRYEQELKCPSDGNATSKGNATAVQLSNEPQEQEGVVNWQEVSRSIPTQRPFYPLLVSLTISIFSFSNIDLLNSRGLAFSIATFFVVIFSLFLVAERLLSAWLARLSLIGAWTLWLLTVLLVCTAGTIAAFLVYSKFGASDIATALVGALLATCVAVITSLCATIFTEVHRATESVLFAVQLTGRKAAALEQELELTKQQIAHVLHGEVQSILTSAAFRLDLAAENLESGGDVKATSAAIDEVRTMLDGATSKIESIAVDQPHPQTTIGGLGLQERINDVCRSWAGIVSIESNMDQNTASRLEARVNQASLAPVVTEIVREAILNAVRHAGAGNVQVAIESTDSVCHITVTNDGESPGSDTSTGLGLETLNRLGYEWSLTPGGQGGGVLSIELPLLTLVAAD